MTWLFFAVAWCAGFGLAYCLMAINPRNDD